MSLITGNWVLDLLAVLIAVGAIIYTRFYFVYLYWARLNVPTIPPSIPWGNMDNPFTAKLSTPLQFNELYKIFKKRGVKYAGVYSTTRAIFLPIDIELVKNIMVKDFDSFVDRGVQFDEKVDPLTAHLFNISGTRWKTLRHKLTPTFTSGKMKMMFDTLLNCTPFMVERIEKNIDQPLDIKEVLCCFTTDVIGTCAFGLDCNSFKSDDAPFRQHGKKLFRLSKLRSLKLLIRRYLPPLFFALNLKFMEKETEEFFMDIVRKTEKYRQDNNLKRNDFMQLVMDMSDQLTFNERAAQAFIFFFAGFETSATTMTFTLYNLAKYPEIQEKVREEMISVLKKHDNKITYEAIGEMKYLGQVIDETLRVFPPVPMLNRRAVKDYKIPGEDLVLEKGTPIVISALGIHHDKDYYPEPEKFDPERFSEENKRKRPTCSFIPFGEGPRICIGLRFGYMQTKVGLTTLLTKYRFKLNPKTQDNPITFDNTQFVLSIDGGCWLDAERL